MNTHCLDHQKTLSSVQLPAQHSCITLHHFHHAQKKLVPFFHHKLMSHYVNRQLRSADTTTILRPFVWDYLGQLVPEETFTHSHLFWSSTILYQLPPSTTIHSILPVQFTCLTAVLHNLSQSPLWSTSWSGTLHFILHRFLHPIIVFVSQSHTIATCFTVGPRLWHLILVEKAQLFT